MSSLSMISFDSDRALAHSLLSADPNIVSVGMPSLMAGNKSVSATASSSAKT